MMQHIGADFRLKCSELKTLELTILVHIIAKMEGDSIDLDPFVFDVQASRLVSIVLDDVDLLILPGAIDEDLTQHYQALSD